MDNLFLTSTCQDVPSCKGSSFNGEINVPAAFFLIASAHKGKLMGQMTF